MNDLEKRACILTCSGHRPRKKTRSVTRAKVSGPRSKGPVFSIGLDSIILARVASGIVGSSTRGSLRVSWSQVFANEYSPLHVPENVANSTVATSQRLITQVITTGNLRRRTTTYRAVLRAVFFQPSSRGSSRPKHRTRVRSYPWCLTANLPNEVFLCLSTTLRLNRGAKPPSGKGLLRHD